MLNNVLLVPLLTAQLLPAAVVTGDSDQAKPWCMCLVLSCKNSHFSVPECMCWHWDTHCAYLRIFRSERTPVIQDPQFCQDHPAHLTQSAELSTRMWFQWVCLHPSSGRRSPSLRGHGSVHCWGFQSLGKGRSRLMLWSSCPSAFPHCSAGSFRAGSVQNQVIDVFYLPNSHSLCAHRMNCEARESDWGLIVFHVFPVIFNFFFPHNFWASVLAGLQKVLISLELVISLPSVLSYVHTELLTSVPPHTEFSLLNLTAVTLC